MKNFRWLFCVLLASICSAQQDDAVTKDAEGHDHPLLKRYEGSFIVAYTEKAYDEYTLILGKALNSSAESSQGKSVEKSRRSKDESRALPT